MNNYALFFGHHNCYTNKWGRKKVMEKEKECLNVLPKQKKKYTHTHAKKKLLEGFLPCL